MRMPVPHLEMRVDSAQQLGNIFEITAALNP